VFDPFGDFENAGYLRNVQRVKEPAIIKTIEHELFRLNLPLALKYLSSLKGLTYADFLKTHDLLFSDFYPWAGKDRIDVAPQVAISKGSVMFAHPADARRAVELGLSLAHDARSMRAKAGEIMGLFAYGHPFLDGNGRTMLLVHMELCHRAGFSIRWADSRKEDYLQALSKEIDSPGRSLLDTYLAAFIDARREREHWGESVTSIQGLDGLDGGGQANENLADPVVAERYHQQELRRVASYGAAGLPEAGEKPGS
jgi:cell filamentation protein